MDERSAAAGVTGVACMTGAALAPVLAGLLLANPALAGAPFVVAGGRKVLYDGLLFGLFRRVRLPEEVRDSAQQKDGPLPPAASDVRTEHPRS
jgi:hypothetical protein